MKTMTHTSTKTAVAWMLVGGVAALVASMAIGLPWDRARLDNQVINTGKTNGNTDVSNVITHKSLQCYKTVNGIYVKVWSSSKKIEEGATGGDTLERLQDLCKNTYKGTTYTIWDDNGIEGKHQDL